MAAGHGDHVFADVHASDLGRTHADEHARCVSLPAANVEDRRVLNMRGAHIEDGGAAGEVAQTGLLFSDPVLALRVVQLRGVGAAVPCRRELVLKKPVVHRRAGVKDAIHCAQHRDPVGCGLRMRSDNLAQLLGVVAIHVDVQKEEVQVLRCEAGVTAERRDELRVHGADNVL